jgi:DUF3102 family protein
MPTTHNSVPSARQDHLDDLAARTAIAISPQHTAEDWRRIIADDLGRAAGGIIAAGRHLQEAKDEVEHGDWLPLLKSLRLSERTAQRLMKIAANEVLANPTHVSHLPPSWGTLYELAMLPPKLLEARIIDGTITPDLARKDIALLRGEAPTNVSRLAVDEPDPPAPKAPNTTLAKEVAASRARLPDEARRGQRNPAAGGVFMFVILVVETGSEVEVELCRVGTNPEPIVAAARAKVIGKRKTPRYRWIRIVEVDEGQS